MKYIIEIPDEVKWGVVTCRTEDEFYTRDFDSLEELNSDYINEHYGDLQDTAYKKGLHDGESKCRYCNEYQRGLEDAWECAKKLFSSMADSDIEKAFPIEWNNGGFYALMNLQPQEAIEKLKAYEEKQKTDEIKVGDEVKAIYNDILGTVTNVNGFEVCVLWRDGSVGMWRVDELIKTNRHFDISSILKEMQS